MPKVKVIGAGLAGSEAAWQLAQCGIEVDLYEQKGVKRHPAFHTDYFAELICSNSLRSDNPENAVGLLKNELRILHSLIMQSADLHRVPAGSSLAVDRLGFSQTVTSKLSAHPLIHIHREEVVHLDPNQETIIATGPLMEGGLTDELCKFIDQNCLYFYDAVAPVIFKDSLNMDKIYYKSRWEDDQPGDYINCPLNKEEYYNFVQELRNAQKIDVKEMDAEVYFEGCMPVEEMARRGIDTLRHGPLKPMGLRHEGQVPYAVVQLRQDDAANSLVNMVGFQTHLTFGEQQRVFRMIPGLENATFARYGVMHRNTYLNSPKLLANDYSLRKYPHFSIAGQMSGVEGYVESAASGCYAALCIAQKLLANVVVKLSSATMMGAMASYISNPATDKLVPMNANFGLISELTNINKRDRKVLRIQRALEEVEKFSKVITCIKN